MGSAASKSTRAAASTARKYPTRTPAAPSTKPPEEQGELSGAARRGLQPAPATAASSGEPARARQGSREDAPKDSALSARLRKLGPVTPAPTLSNSSTFNLSDGSLRSPNLPPLPARRWQAAGARAGSVRPHEPSQGMAFAPSASSPAQSIFPTMGLAGMRGNPAVALLEARERLQEAADREFADLGRQTGRERGRQFLDVGTIRSVLVMVGEGKGEGEIERALGLQRGVAGRLRGGVYGVTGV